MKKSEIRSITNFSIFSYDAGQAGRMGEFWVIVSEQKLEVMKRTAKFLKWYSDDSDEDCPFTREELAKLADEIIESFASAAHDLLPKHRQDYHLLRRMFCEDYISDIFLAETVKLIDFIVKRGIV